MAIAYDATANGTNAPATGPLTFSHTCSGSNRFLVVGIATFSGDIITGVTYNSVALELKSLQEWIIQQRENNK